MQPDEALLQKIESGAASDAEIASAAIMLVSADAAARQRVGKTLLRAVQAMGGDSVRVHALLDAMSERFASQLVVTSFVRQAKESYDKSLEAAYRKIINPRSGAPCCPVCSSPNIAEVGGAYEFAQMHCFDCGNDEYCDPYQVGDWYR